MSTIDIDNEATEATAALLTLSGAARAAAAKRQQEIEDARKTQAEIDYAAALAKRQQQDVIDNAEEILGQIAPPAAPTPPAADPVPPVLPPVDDDVPPAADPVPPVLPPVDDTPPAPPVPPVDPAPAPAPTRPAPPALPARRNVFVVIVHFFRGFGWGGIALGAALAFLAVSLLLFLSGYDGFFPGKPEGLRIFGVVAISAFAFFAGGTIGAIFDRLIVRRADAAAVVETDDTVV